MNRSPAKHTPSNAPRSGAPNYARWRTCTLAGVYVLFVAHIVHWKLSGRTLAPLELNEVMYTLELGIVTAGFLFMILAVLATLIFGRFFCSWGCHILALEDLAACLLGKLRIRPKPIRSRVLRWVPWFAMLYMFVWPQLLRWIEGRPMPAMHLRTDAQGWASFLTTEFWRNLPGPGVTIMTFAVCGFAIVYVLGSRAFCTYACPYGAVFALADRFAPGRIVARGDCSRCGACTAACQSRVAVHQELIAYGRVVDPACLKDLDCVAACPNGAVVYGRAAPAILTIGGQEPFRRPAYEFTRTEEGVMAVGFIAALLIFRGLYEVFPFLLTIGIAAILAYFCILAMRLARRAHVRLANVSLRTPHRLMPAGWAFFLGGAVLLGLSIHSGFIRYHAFQADNCLAGSPDSSVSTSARGSRQTAVSQAIGHLEFCTRWGLLESPSQRQRLAALLAEKGQWLADQSDFRAAASHLARSIAFQPGVSHTHYNLALVLAATGQRADAEREYRRAIELNADDADAWNNLGLLRAEADDLEAARSCFERAAAIRPDFAAARFNLGRAYQSLGMTTKARESYAAARRIDSTFDQPIRDLLRHMPPDSSGTNRK